MRRLRDLQLVALHVVDVQATCRIVAVGGDEAVLEPEHPSAHIAAALPAKATLAFAAEGRSVTLSGMAGTGPVDGTLAFWAIEALEERELRLRPRLSAAFEVQLRPAGGNGPVITRDTIDISAGGLLVAGPVAEPMGTRFELQMALPGLQRPITATAEVVRRRPTEAALEFVDLDAGVGRTIERLIYAMRQQQARRAFAAARHAA